jgi:hypothetical protein
VDITVRNPGDRAHPLRRRAHDDLPGSANRLHWSFEDRLKTEGSEEERLEVFRSARDRIRQRIKEYLVGRRGQDLSTA